MMLQAGQSAFGIGPDIMKNKCASLLYLPAFTLTVIISLLGCVKDNASQQKHAPSISNLHPSSTSVLQGDGGGSIIISGSVDFVDVGGDVELITTTYYDSDGEVTHTTTTPLSDIAGHKSGTIDLDVAADTTVTGNYEMKIYISDAAGSRSNELTGRFEVLKINVVAFR